MSQLIIETPPCLPHTKHILVKSCLSNAKEIAYTPNFPFGNIKSNITSKISWKSYAISETQKYSHSRFSFGGLGGLGESHLVQIDLERLTLSTRFNLSSSWDVRNCSRPNSLPFSRTSSSFYNLPKAVCWGPCRQYTGLWRMSIQVVMNGAESNSKNKKSIRLCYSHIYLLFIVFFQVLPFLCKTKFTLCPRLT